MHTCTPLGPKKLSSLHAPALSQIKDICAVLCGLVVAQDYKKGQQLVSDRSFADNAPFFQVSLVLVMAVNVVKQKSVNKTGRWLVSEHSFANEPSGSVTCL